MPYNASHNEKDILAFWDKENIFERSVNERSKNEPYVFYDGPPFATGLPHYGHIVASVMKDVVPRYFTMQGKRVERVWGWDCHGLPIENIVEKELGTKSKKDIEELGVEKFNELCRSKVLSYVGEWQKTIHRLGRWVDMEHAYRTMDLGYMESVWWVFKQLWEKGLVYEDYRSMHICPRCETTLSQQEVSEGYQEVKDISVFPKFKIINAKEKLGIDGDVYMIAWTTTPWTLPGNVALAVGAEIEYLVVKNFVEHNDSGKALYEHVLVSKDYFDNVDISNPSNGFKFLFSDVSGSKETPTPASVVKSIKGSLLVDLKYEPLFPYYKETPNAFRVVAADFVTTEDGTGVVHIAPAFGDDDFQVGKREGIPLVQHVGMDGRFKSEVTDFAGQEVKPRSEDDKIRLSSDIAIVRYLQEHGLFFDKKNIQHTYPHCWRCDTPLLNYATSSWFVSVTKVKDAALEEAKKINWSPEHIKEGRFGKWLEGARDWSISRQRFWASVIPVWRCTVDSCKHTICFGSVAELEKISGQSITDIHKHIVDDVTFACDSCGGTMKRIPDVLDTWFDSGSMPFAQLHYPFENADTFKAGFPAEFIAEGQDQTRAWFYYLHILSTAIMGTPAFKNVIVNGIVLAEDGKKMSKKLKNYPDPNEVLERYGADALRLYLASSPVMHAESLNFSEVGVREVYNKVVNSLANVLEFYEMYGGNSTEKNSDLSSIHVLDTWILARLQQVVGEVTHEMNAYRLAEAVRPLFDFVSDLSQWYVRRSRDRFKGLTSDADKQAALQTLGQVLFTTSQLLAPFAPFLAEKIFLSVKQGSDETSVHLTRWPQVDAALLQEHVLSSMQRTRDLVSLGLSTRAAKGLKVRQILGELRLAQGMTLSTDYIALVQDELNVKTISTVEEAGMPTSDEWVAVGQEEVSYLYTTITPELQKEGVLRELVRAVNMMRKDQGLTIDDTVVVEYHTESPLLLSVFETYADELAKQVLAKSVVQGEGGEVVDVAGESLALRVTKE